MEVRDSNGTLLNDGDSVQVIKDLQDQGADAEDLLPEESLTSAQCLRAATPPAA